MHSVQKIRSKGRRHFWFMVVAVTSVYSTDPAAAGGEERLNVSCGLVRSILSRWKKSSIFLFLSKQKVLKTIIHLVSSCSV